jgi:hypothetical protein
LNAEIDSSGPLSLLMIERGSKDDVKRQLRELGLETRVEMPSLPGESFSIPL